MADPARVQQLVEAYLRADEPLERYLASLDDDVRPDVARALTVLVTDEPQLRAAAAAMRPQHVGGCVLLERIGAGAMGEVYRARQVELDRIVAIKLMRAELQERREFLARFRSESRLLASLDHPGIVKVLTSGEQDGWLYFTMEHVEGRDLAAAMPELRRSATDGERGRRYDRIVRIAAEILDALAHAHRRGVVHRDLKPSNVVLDADDRPHVVDFGLAKSSASAGRTTLGLVVGTPAYMSPEAADGRPHPREHIDLWAVGAMLHEALVGRPPYERASLEQTLQAVRSPVRVDLRVSLPDVPRPLAAIVERALAPDWQERYPSAHLFAQDLRNFVADQPVAAQRWSPLLALRHHLRRRRWRYLAAAGLAATAGLAWVAADVAAAQRTLLGEISGLERAANASSASFGELGQRASEARSLLASGRLDTAARARVDAALQAIEQVARQRHRQGEALVTAGAGSRRGTALEQYHAPAPAVLWAGLHAVAEARLVLPDLPAPEALLATTQPSVTVEDPAAGSGLPLRIQALDDITGRPLLDVVVATTPWHGSLAPGRYRITVGTPAAFAECSRTFWQPGEHVVTPVVRDTAAVVGSMASIAGGTAVIGQDLRGATAYARTVISFAGFCIDRTEVTCGVFHEYCRTTGAPLPREWHDGYDPAWRDLPVVGVSFAEATACAEWLGKRLPSWAEWQIAARGLQGALYPWGDDAAPLASMPTLGHRGPWHEHVHAVGTTPLDTSWCGVFDMLGNVGEWTDTPFVALFEGAPFAFHPWRVRAGASWYSTPDPEYVALHDVVPGPPEVRETGFRCAKSILP